MKDGALFVQPTEVANGSAAFAVSKGHGPYREQSPRLSRILNQLQLDFYNYKYTVYRCASKFVALQKHLFTSGVPYKLILAVLERHGIGPATGADFMVLPFQLNSVIRDFFFASEKWGHFSKVGEFRLDTATAVLANFFWDIFDPHRRYSVSLLEIKVTFLLLCRLNSSDRLPGELHKLLLNPMSKCISRLHFEYLVNILTKVFAYLGEGSAYGVQNKSIIMEQFYLRCRNGAGLSESQFLCLWSKSRTRFLIYANLLSLIKRIEDTEKLIHSNVCASCRQDQIIGIRFKCHYCKNLSLCLKCFATGYASNKHRAGHRMYEVFVEDAPPKKVSQYFASLCNFFASEGEEKRAICETSEAGNPNETELVTIATNRTTSSASTATIGSAMLPRSTEVIALAEMPPRDLHPKDTVDVAVLAPLHGLTTMAANATNASERLQSIIDRLLKQNLKLEDQLRNVSAATHEEISAFLSAHQTFLIEIINEMRTFSQTPLTAEPSSSTPHRGPPAGTNIANSFASIGSKLTHSINGADINRSYLEANKSEYSLNDLSFWFNSRRMTNIKTREMLQEIVDKQDSVGLGAVTMRETEMTNFRLLLNKVKEIVEDSYSDNTELAAATNNLENVLDSIIHCEETRRKST